MEHEVRNNAAASRYELVVAGSVVGHADYRIHEDVIILPHTVIAPQMRGRGLGDLLVAGALDDIRSSGRRVVPACWFVADFIDARSQYHDLLTG